MHEGAYFYKRSGDFLQRFCLYRPDKTVVSTWWNSSFVLMKHAIRLLIEPGSSARSVTPV
ncbi:MAG: hypothetical protein ACLT68_02400 [Phocaeicola coprophilus]|uniref:hypothetical protein n=1 Tax=Phocaeicola coprophilus TaxID=387090 RepID=UPI003992D25F